MEIKILGSGCATCHKLMQMTTIALQELKITASVKAVTDFDEIKVYTMSSPGLVVNGRLKHAGKPLPTLEKLKDYIRSESAR